MEGGEEERRSLSAKFHVFALVSCVTLFSKGEDGWGASESHGAA